MPNIATVLKDEIARVARKQVRSEIASLKKATATYRLEIASLKRRVQVLEQQLRRLGNAVPRAKPAGHEDTHSSAIRFSAKGLASHRKRLGLSADECGLLVGASGQSVYNWEAAKSRPRTVHLAAITALKTIGKKEAAVRLNALQKAGRKRAT